MKCKDIEILKKHIDDVYGVKGLKVAEGQTQFKISKFVVNVYDTGTVNFQGKPNEQIKNELENYIEIVNNKEKK